MPRFDPRSSRPWVRTTSWGCSAEWTWGRTSSPRRGASRSPWASWWDESGSGAEPGRASPFPGDGRRFLEYRLDAPRDAIASARLLAHPARDRLGGVEVWWAGEDRAWSEGRSVRWRIDPSQPGREWAVPLDRLPHWDGRAVRYVRIAFRFSGTVLAGPPRLLP